MFCKYFNGNVGYKKIKAGFPPVILEFMCHRSKINELHAENARLNKEIENASDENSSFLSYEKRYV